MKSWFYIVFVCGLFQILSTRWTQLTLPYKCTWSNPMRDPSFRPTSLDIQSAAFGLSTSMQSIMNDQRGLMDKVKQTDWKDIYFIKHVLFKILWQQRDSIVWQIVKLLEFLLPCNLSLMCCKARHTKCWTLPISWHIFLFLNYHISLS